MRVDYDSKGDTIQIDLIDRVERVDYGDDEVDDWLVVGILDGRPVRIDVIGTDGNTAESLLAAARKYDLDADALIAAAGAALSSPDREIVL